MRRLVQGSTRAGCPLRDGRPSERPVLLGGIGVPVPALIEAVLRRVALETARVAGAPLAQAALTYPAGWGPRRREILCAAAATVFARPRLVPVETTRARLRSQRPPRRSAKKRPRR